MKTQYAWALTAPNFGLIGAALGVSFLMDGMLAMFLLCASASWICFLLSLFISQWLQSFKVGRRHSHSWFDQSRRIFGQHGLLHVKAIALFSWACCFLVTGHALYSFFFGFDPVKPSISRVFTLASFLAHAVFTGLVQSEVRQMTYAFEHTGGLL